MIYRWRIRKSLCSLRAYGRDDFSVWARCPSNTALCLALYLGAPFYWQFSLYDVQLEASAYLRFNNSITLTPTPGSRSAVNNFFLDFLELAVYGIKTAENFIQRVIAATIRVVRRRRE